MSAGAAKQDGVCERGAGWVPSSLGARAGLGLGLGLSLGLALVLFMVSVYALAPLVWFVRVLLRSAKGYGWWVHPTTDDTNDTVIVIVLFVPNCIGYIHNIHEGAFNGG